jgi:phage shock protein E
MSTVAAVIDVRTPEEVSAGYLEGALKFDFQGPNFATEIATLDKSKDYVIYCRSGNRAGGAIDFMKQNGFTGTLTNAGGLSEASTSTGLPIVQ